MTTMKFQVGDQVVHPQHGLGRVVKLEHREFEPGTVREYYEISLMGGSTVWVPMDLSISGLRKVTSRGEITRCRKILEARPSPLDEDARFRQAGLAARLKKGTIRTQCEVVRDLYAYGEHRSLNGTIGIFYKAAQEVLCQEWSVVEDIPLMQAAHEIEILLEKSRLALKEEANA